VGAAVAATTTAATFGALASQSAASSVSLVGGSAWSSGVPGSSGDGGVFKSPAIRLVPAGALRRSSAAHAMPPPAKSSKRRHHHQGVGGDDVDEVEGDAVTLEGYELDATSEAELRDTVSLPLVASRLGVPETAVAAVADHWVRKRHRRGFRALLRRYYRPTAREWLESRTPTLKHKYVTNNTSNTLAVLILSPRFVLLFQSFAFCSVWTCVPHVFLHSAKSFDSKFQVPRSRWNMVILTVQQFASPSFV
jgi:hypothetical protein